MNKFFRLLALAAIFAVSFSLFSCRSETDSEQYWPTLPVKPDKTDEPDEPGVPDKKSAEFTLDGLDVETPEKISLEDGEIAVSKSSDGGIVIEITPKEGFEPNEGGVTVKIDGVEVVATKGEGGKWILPKDSIPENAQKIEVEVDFVEKGGDETEEGLFVKFVLNLPDGVKLDEEMPPQKFEEGVPQSLFELKVVIPNIPDTSIPKYRFFGWAESPDGPMVYRDNEQIAISETTTLYAKWLGVIQGTISDVLDKLKLNSVEKGSWYVVPEDLGDIDSESENFSALQEAIDDKGENWQIYLDLSQLSLFTSVDGCSKNLYAIILPDELTEIGEGAFQDCSHIEYVKIPNKVEYIGEKAFKGTAITQITIPEKVSRIDSNAFSSCSNLRSITIEDDGSLETRDLISCGLEELESLVNFRFEGTKERWIALKNPVVERWAPTSLREIVCSDGSVPLEESDYFSVD